MNQMYPDTLPLNHFSARRFSRQGGRLRFPAVCLAAFFFLILSGCLYQPAAVMASAPDLPGSSSPLTVLVTSDLHYTTSVSVSSVVVPGMAHIEEIADALVNEVISLHPDVFIMTGDNTSNGTASSAGSLFRKLQKIRKAGIQVILTTGNHDLDASDAGDYRSQYPCHVLADVTDEDEASLSYTVVLGNAVFLAMDDNASVPGQVGIYSDATMEWLRQMLEKYQSYRIFFLSHHNVTIGFDESDPDAVSSYRIRNHGLIDLLSQYRVTLILTGHLHSQMIQQTRNLYEIISSMPVSGSRSIGFLSIGSNGLSYQTHPIDFRLYGSDELADRLEELDRQSGQSQMDSFRNLIDSEITAEDDREGILALTERFFSLYGQGELYSHQAELLADPNYEAMIRVFWNHNYGPWIKSAIENAAMSSSHLELSY